MQNDNSPDPIDVYVGERLRLARNLRGLSQEYIGSYVGVKFQQIQKYESGANRISASKLARFARLLGVPIHYFFQGLPTEYHDGGPPIAPLDNMPHVDDVDILFRRETHKLINLYYSIKDDNRRKTFVDILEAMALRHPAE